MIRFNFGLAVITQPSFSPARFTAVRVSAKYHGIKLEYDEQRHALLDLLSRIRSKVLLWKRPYLSPEAVRLLLHEWHVRRRKFSRDPHTIRESSHRFQTSCYRVPFFPLAPMLIAVIVPQELVTNQELPSLLEATLRQLKQVLEKYSGKSALGETPPFDRLERSFLAAHGTGCSPGFSAADYQRVCQQVTQLEEDAAAVLSEVRSAENTLGRVLTAWDSYSDGLSSMQAWLEQVSAGRDCGSQARVFASVVCDQI